MSLQHLSPPYPLTASCYNRAVNPFPASDPLLLALAAAQAAHELFPVGQDAPQPVVVGVSGGADSVCLLHALVQMAARWKLALHVAHVDHGLRPQSAAEGDFVAGLAAHYALPLHVTQLDPDALRTGGLGLEAAARHARYTFLGEVARAVTPDDAVPCVAVAHHAGDQAETVLLRLVQGSGLAGLGGLRPLSEVPLPVGPGERSVRLVRPLLGVGRADILAYLAGHGLRWMEDASNADLHFVRNRLRAVVLPALAAINPGIVATLCRNAELWAGDAARLAALDAAALARLALEPPSDERVTLDLHAWQELAPAERRGVLRAAFAHLGADARQLGFAHLSSIVQHAAPAPSDRRSGQGPDARGELSSGPHPLPGGLAWSVIGAFAGAPARLCLHAAAAAPVSTPYPRLDADWRQAHTQQPLPIPGVVVVGEWQLAASILPAANLPPNWQALCGPWRLFAAAAALDAAVLTAPRPGLRIAPLGMGGSHRRVVDLLRDHKVPISLRQEWPLLVDSRNGQVLWVCGVQGAEQLRITAQTEQVVLLEWLRSEGS